MRAAEAKGEFMPDWVPFSESEVCQLCKADFSWASTSKSEVRGVPRVAVWGSVCRALGLSCSFVGWVSSI